MLYFVHHPCFLDALLKVGAQQTCTDWMNEWRGLLWGLSRVVYWNCIRQRLAKSRHAKWKLFWLSSGARIIFFLGSLCLAESKQELELDQENIVKGCFCETDGMRAPTLPFWNSSFPLRKEAHQWGRQDPGSVCSRLTPCFQPGLLLSILQEALMSSPCSTDTH